MGKKYNTKIKIIILIGLFAIALFYYRNATFTTAGDDEVYRTSIETWGSWVNWAKAYYFGNSGRIIIHSLLIIILNLPVDIFRILSSIMVVVTCMGIYQIINVRKKSNDLVRFLIISIIFCGMFFAINNLGGIIRWASGALNYLYPVSAMLFVLIPFVMSMNERKIPILYKCISIMFVFLCGNMEQSSAVVMVLGMLIFIYIRFQRKNYDKADILFLIILWIINLTVFILSYMAPGVEQRYISEMIRCCGYGMLSIPQKLILGMQIYTLYLYSFRGLIILVIPILASIIISLKQKNKKNLLIAVVNLILCGLQNIIIRKFIDIQFIYPYNKTYVVWLIFTSILILMTGYLVIESVEEKSDKYLYGFLFLAAFIAGIIPAFSPTLFVSAARTMYITYIILILIAAKLWTEVFEREKPYTQLRNCEKIFINGYLVIAGIIIVFLPLWYVINYHNVKEENIDQYTLSRKYKIENKKFDYDKGEIHAQIAVEDFKCITNNWCTGLTEGYDINIKVGILNTKSKKIYSYQTVLNTQYPVMEKYPSGKVNFTGFYKKKIKLKKHEKYVLLIKNHEGNKLYQYLE